MLFIVVYLALDTVNMCHGSATLSGQGISNAAILDGDGEYPSQQILGWLAVITLLCISTAMSIWTGEEGCGPG